MISLEVFVSQSTAEVVRGIGSRENLIQARRKMVWYITRNKTEPTTATHRL